MGSSLVDRYGLGDTKRMRYVPVTIVRLAIGKSKSNEQETSTPTSALFKYFGMPDITRSLCYNAHRLSHVSSAPGSYTFPTLTLVK